MSTRRRTDGVYSRKRPLGPNGERICYNCNGPLPKGKPFNCSSKCSEEWRCKTSPSHLRFVLFQRDKGICALCDSDTVDLKKQYDAIRTRLKQTHTYRYQDGEAGDFLKLHGIPWGRIISDWWDADHIVPVTEGGGECGTDNLRTLCIPCHKKETAELHRRLAHKRHVARPLPLFDSSNETPTEAAELAGGKA